MHPADRGEQRQVRADQVLLRGDGEQPGRAGVALLVHVVAQSRDELSPLALPGHGDQGERVPAFLVGRQRAVGGGEHVVQEASAVLGDAEEPGAAAEQAGGQRTLDGVGRGQVGEPADDGRWREAVVREGGENRFEHPGFAPAGPLINHGP